MIFSIGHGNKDIDRFLEELKAFRVDYVADVRSKPHSKHHPQFDKESLAIYLRKMGIKYVFMGDQLGGLPNDESCYVNGKVSYDILTQKEYFQKGIERLVIAQQKQLNIAVMCSESAPGDCHRSKAIGEALFKKNITLQHIVSPTESKDQLTVINELTKGKSGADLFGNPAAYSSRKAYR